MVWFPTVEYILEIFNKQIERPSLLNLGGLISTLDKVTWGIPSLGIPTIWERVTILFKELGENHYFSDGNKRIGILIAFIFLSKNGYDFYPPIKEIFTITMEVAQLSKDFESIKIWFNKNSKKII